MRFALSGPYVSLSVADRVETVCRTRGNVRMRRAAQRACIEHKAKASMQRVHNYSEISKQKTLIMCTCSCFRDRKGNTTLIPIENTSVASNTEFTTKCNLFDLHAWRTLESSLRNMQSCTKCRSCIHRRGNERMRQRND